MKLGLITDIHERVEYLRTALDRFQAEGVDQVVVIGDVFEMGERITTINGCWSRRIESKTGMATIRSIFPPADSS